MVMMLNIRGIDTFSPMTACLSCLRGLQRGIWTDFVAGFASISFWLWLAGWLVLGVPRQPLQACNSVFIWIFHIIGGLSWPRDVRLEIRARHCRSLGPCGVLLLFFLLFDAVAAVSNVLCPIMSSVQCIQCPLSSVQCQPHSCVRTYIFCPISRPFTFFSLRRQVIP